MKILNKVTVGTKLFTCYLIIVALAVTLGGLAIFRLNQLNSIVGDLSGNLAVNQHLSDELESSVLLSRFYAVQYINQQDPADLDRYRAEMANFKDHLSQSQEKISKAKQVKMLNQMEARVETFEQKFAEATVLVSEQQQVRDKVLNSQAAMAGERLDRLYSDTFQTDDNVALYLVGNARQEFDAMRLGVVEHLAEGNEAVAVKLDAEYQGLVETFDRLAEELDDSSQLRLAAKAEANIALFYEGFQSVRSGRDRQKELIANLSSLSSQLQTTASGMSSGAEADIAARAELSDGIVGQTQLLMLIIILAVVGVGLGFGAVVDQTIRSRLDQVPKLAADLAANIMNLRMDFLSKDGAGVVAEAFNKMTSNIRDRFEEEADLRKN